MEIKQFLLFVKHSRTPCIIIHLIQDVCALSDLIEGGEYVVSKLYFSNGSGANISSPYSESDNALFAQGRVENALLSVFILQPQSAAKHSPECHVLAKN